ncbi:hypothetical protein RHMOL_Rhmol03G0233400 [Rhododendron molle]|uniref:Uncharacterized protein n=1 Tax=Rhododendron molle TaxID=49168 RepID=A0ACC0PH99_RHOML|nr:hypothetical protein RHMOL_Rhmol03G0233400 [Rhododendron molle]
MTTALMALSLPLRVGIKATLLPSSSNHEPQLIFSTYNISSTRSAMAPRIKTSLLLLFLLISSLSLGKAEGFNNNVNPIYSLHKGAVRMNLRKLLVFDTVLDYDYTGANPKHDRKGKPGSGGKNP